MKQMILAILGTVVICLSGCAKRLPPHEELNQAVKKSLDASGYNYRSKSRITNLTFPKQDVNAAPDDERLKNPGTGLDIVRGFSVNIDGALDLKAKKSEVLYDLHYHKDNVEISIKVPLLFDYNTQTIYIGRSFLNTILDMVSPQSSGSGDRLIKLNLGELLQESTPGAPDLSKLFGDNRFNATTIDIINNVFKAGILKSVAKLNDDRFSDLPLTGQDKRAGVERRIQVKLGHGDSVAVILDTIGSMSQALFQEGVIDKEEHAALLTLTDKQMLEGFINKFSMAMTNDVGVGSSGHVSYLLTRLDVADNEGTYQVGIENVSSFDSYNAPRFTISPEAHRIVEFKEVLKALQSVKPKDKNTPQPVPDGSAAPEPPARNDSKSML